jgi:hypothetical protein
LGTKTSHLDIFNCKDYLINYSKNVKNINWDYEAYIVTGQYNNRELDIIELSALFSVLVNNQFLDPFKFRILHYFLLSVFKVIVNVKTKPFKY